MIALETRVTNQNEPVRWYYSS